MPNRLTTFLIFAFCFTISAQTVRGEGMFAELFNSSKYQELSNELIQLQSKNPDLFVQNHYSYLLGRTSERRGDLSTAAAHYQETAAKDVLLRPYALKHLSELMRMTGNLGVERIFLNELIYSEEQTIPGTIARSRLIRNYFETGQFKTVINLLVKGQTVAEPDIPGGDGRELSVILGKSYLRDNQPKTAQEVFHGLIDSLPDSNRPDDYALEAVKGLDLLEVGKSKFGTEVANLVAVEHMQRAGIYQFNRNFDLARLHYEAIVNNHVGNGTIPESMIQIARGFDQQRDYQNAAIWFERLRNEAPKDELAAPALYGMAGVNANLGKTEAAVAAYNQYIVENPGAPNIERAYLNIVDAYRDAGDDVRALEWTAKTQRAFPGKVGEAIALFAEVRIQISQADWNRALTGLRRLETSKDLGGINIAGGTNKTEVTFLTGYVLEKLGKDQDARSIYISIEDGRGEYYGWRAGERLKKMSPENRGPGRPLRTEFRQQQNGAQKLGNPPEAEYEIPLYKDGNNQFEPLPPKILDGKIEPSDLKTAKPDGLSNTPGVILLEFGLYDEAAPEVESSLRKKTEKVETYSLSDFDDNIPFTLATLYSRGGFADRGIQFIEPRWKKVPADYKIASIPKDQAMLLYPVPYRDSLLKYGKKMNVDPRLLLSIMRQESRFQADIKSPAAARGLMQFISGTANEMASQMKIERFSQDDLYDPDTAVMFGAHYVSNIFKDFPDKPQAVAASYNGGEDRMARWLKRAKSDDPDQYVAEIVFTQTKDYVYKVMANYRMYQYLYDENLEARTYD